MASFIFLGLALSSIALVIHNNIKIRKGEPPSREFLRGSLIYCSIVLALCVLNIIFDWQM